jgi:1-acyl-sn-glycerol-3-phosphate acyltransferase
MMATLVTGLVRLLAGASTRWVGCEPAARQRIYFPNHTSNLDGVVVWAALPPAVRKATRPVAAHDYWTANPVRQYFAERVFHSVLIERKHVTASNNPLEPILAALDAGASLIIFPEGRRNSEPEAGEFKSGIYHIAKKRPGIELVPVHIDNMNRILPKGEILPVPLLSCLSFGTPMHVGEEEPKKDFLERARKAVNDLRQS